jgi:hypothetical protein
VPYPIFESGVGEGSVLYVQFISGGVEAEWSGWSVFQAVWIAFNIDVAPEEDMVLAQGLSTALAVDEKCRWKLVTL